MNSLGSRGVCVLEDKSGVISIRHGITTDITNVNRSAISVVSTKDWVKKRVRTNLDNAYIGTKLTGATTKSMEKTVVAFLDTLINDSILTAKRDISVSQNATEPRQMDVTFAISVVYPLEFIEVSFSLYVA